MNELSVQKRVAIKNLLMDGNSVRNIAAAVGCSKLTVGRYKRLYAVSAKCGCGKSAGHNGWCWFRIQFSPQRCEWFRERWKIRAQIPSVIASAIGAATKQGHQIGPFVWNSGQSVSIAQAVCVVCGKALRVYGGNAPWERYEKWQRFSGAAVEVRCKTPEQRQQERLQREDRKQWLEGKRKLKEVTQLLRQSRWPKRASTPAHSSLA